MNWLFTILVVAVAVWRGVENPMEGAAGGILGVAALCSCWAVRHYDRAVVLFLLLASGLVLLGGGVTLGWVEGVMLATMFHAAGQGGLSPVNRHAVPWLVMAGALIASIVAGVLVSASALVAVLTAIAAVAGYLIGWSGRWVGEDAELSIGDTDELLEEAGHALAEMRLPHARRLLDRAAAEAPRRLDVAQMAYAAWKYDPMTPEFTQCAGRLFELLDDDHFLGAWRDYLAVAQMRPQLDNQTMLGLAKRLAELGAVEQAAPIINVFVQRDINMAGLDEGVVAIMKASERAGDQRRAERYADILLDLFPKSVCTQEALALLTRLRGHKA